MVGSGASEPSVAWLRAGLVLLAASNTAVGAWLLFLPGSFYSDFPGLGLHWVSALPPYNEHLLTDYGGALLGVSAVLWLAAVFLERRLVQAALIAQLVQAVPHFVYHVTRAEALPTGEAIANQVLLALPVLLALVLLVLTVDRPRAQAAGGAGTSQGGERTTTEGRP